MGAVHPDLKGRSVLVIGGGSGIGEGIVRDFAAQGAKVGFIDVNEEASSAVAQSNRDSGGHVEYKIADVRDIAALRKAIAAIGDGNGPATIKSSRALAALALAAAADTSGYGQYTRKAPTIKIGHTDIYTDKFRGFERVRATFCEQLASR